MPVVGKLITRRVDFTWYPEEAYVILVLNPTGKIFSGDIPDFEKVNFLEFVLSKTITDWNFTDEKGVKLPITLENIQKAFNEFDKMKLTKILGLNTILEEEKKTQSVSSSSPAVSNLSTSPSTNTDKSST